MRREATLQRGRGWEATTIAAVIAVVASARWPGAAAESVVGLGVGGFRYRSVKQGEGGGGGMRSVG